MFTLKIVVYLRKHYHLSTLEMRQQIFRTLQYTFVMQNFNVRFKIIRSINLATDQNQIWSMETRFSNRKT